MNVYYQVLVFTYYLHCMNMSYMIFFPGFDNNNKNHNNNNKNKGRKTYVYHRVRRWLRSTCVIYMPGCGAVKSATARVIDREG